MLYARPLHRLRAADIAMIASAASRGLGYGSLGPYVTPQFATLVNRDVVISVVNPKPNCDRMRQGLGCTWELRPGARIRPAVYEGLHLVDIF